MVKRKTKNRARQNANSIIIDEDAGLVFHSEEELFNHFTPVIEALELEYSEARDDADFSDEEQLALEENLEETLQEPDEVWFDDATDKETPIHAFIKDFKGFHYVALAYASAVDNVPTFVLIHFPTKSPKVLKYYQRGEPIFSEVVENVRPAALEGDALCEMDPLAVGLYMSMLKLRTEKDVPLKDYQDYKELREETIENADEIWKKADSEGNSFVTFIKEFPDHATSDLFYVAVTQEDPQTNVHALLFSFPTTDAQLVDRYRLGENLHAEEVTQESSH